MDFSTLIMQIDNILWATPLIILTFGLALIYCIAIKFGNVTNIKTSQILSCSGNFSQRVKALRKACLHSKRSVP